MAILSDFHKPPVGPIEPVKPKLDDCLRELLRRIGAGTTGEHEWLDVTLIAPNWPLHCDLEKCVSDAENLQLLRRNGVQVTLTAEGRRSLSS